MRDAQGVGARRGFTLLEVLVAVALLGIVVSVLARSAVEGMGFEGDAGRRTRASLLADRALFPIEAGLRLGPAKPLHEESEEGEFRVVVDVQPIELGPGGLDALLGAPKEKPKAGERAAASAPAPPTPGLSLFRILVSVSWFEGLHELSVTRSSFAYDASAAAEALGAKDEEKRPSPPAEEQEPTEEQEP